MTPVVHCSAGIIHFFPRTSTSISHREIHLTKPYFPGNSKRSALSQRHLFSESSLNLFQIYRSGCLCKDGSKIQYIAAVGSDLAVEESNPSVSGETTEKTSEAPTTSAETSESTSTNPVVNAARSRRPRGARKSDMPPVKNEELTPGASFTGKVRSIQPFGAFVDFGAFTDGLVHVSRMSDGYVKDVASLVSVGQEVKVRIVEANMESGRISLTMRESDDPTKPQQSSDRPRPARKNAARSTQKPDEAQKSTKFVKGQVLSGTIKNTVRSGSFVSLPDGEEGFIPTSEEAGGSDSFMGNSSLQIGQEVNVRVLRITRGQVTLTMKKEEVDVKELNKQLNKGVVQTATNPFELAFRSNKDIAAFLNDRESAQKSSEDVSLPSVSEQGEDKDDGTVTKPDVIVVDDSTTSVEPSSGELVHGDEEQISNLPQSIDSVQEALAESSDSGSIEIPVADESSSKSLIPEESLSSTSSITDELSIVEGKNEADTESASGTREDLTSEAPTVDGDPAKDEVKETVVESAVVSENDVSSKSLEIGEDGNSADPIIVDDSTPEASYQILASNVDVSEGDEVTEADDTTAKLETEATVVLEDEVAPANSNNIEAGSPEISSGQAGTSQQSGAAKATISPALVKQLREETGAGMMDCKMALSETGGDIVKAQEFLRKKGLASADKKSSRATAEGRIGSYIHDSRIGILIEVNCETDFVSRGEIFKELVDDLAMQVAACPQVSYLVTEDIPEEIVNKEREIEMQKEDLLSKPEQIRPKIVEGRIRKRLEEFALLEQPFIKNDKVLVKDLVKQTIATIGENIKVKRFVRYNLGEGLEKRSQDFASEVAAQTVAKESPTAPKDQPVDIKETVDKPPAIAISAALVKQLREESGAGMMDCKKALTETGGNLEKAQDYLRKKGLSSAEKKSSRIAAEGRVSAYVHDTRIGCLIEVNSETDFVARNERFKELVDDLAMQVVACPQVEFVSMEEIPESVVNKEKEIEMQRDDLKSKPENIREKIVEGRISKRLGELVLLEQPFIKDDKVLVKDLVKQTVAALGENIRVRRFVRFTLGETTD